MGDGSEENRYGVILQALKKTPLKNNQYGRNAFRLGDKTITVIPGPTFMYMKEDHISNGQLKLEYNIQVAIENNFIIHSYVSNDRTDYNTLFHVLKTLKAASGIFLEATTTNSGYYRGKNLLHLKENGITSYIKLQDHEQRKTRAYTENIGKYDNMKCMIYEDEHYYICHGGRELHHI